MNAPRGIMIGIGLGVAVALCVLSGWWAIRPAGVPPVPTRSTIGPH